MKLTGLTPNLFNQDLNRSTAFYRDVLGFSVVTTVPDEAPFVFVWMRRDDVAVFLNDAATALKDAPELTSVTVGRSGVTMFIHLEGITDLWNAIKDRAPIVMPLKDQWYGMTEFSVADPDGYVITFGERRAS